MQSHVGDSALGCRVRLHPVLGAPTDAGKSCQLRLEPCLDRKTPRASFTYSPHRRLDAFSNPVSDFCMSAKARSKALTSKPT